MSTRLLASARRLLPGAVAVTVRDGNNTRLVVTERGSRLVRLRRIHERIICALATGPVPGKTLAKRAKCNNTGYFRRAVADLVALGCLRRSNTGYVSFVP